MIKSFCRSDFLFLVALAALVLTGVSQAMAKECLDCHADILKQMKGNSHHVQGVAVSGRHCYACHWEATAEGRINVSHHRSPAKKSTKVKDRKVDLVIWEQAVRPTVYKPGLTAITFLASKLGTPTERAEVAKVTRHCLGCHSDNFNVIRTFSGDTNVPVKYAWDGQSVASRYSQKGGTLWGKYSTAATNKKQRVIKSFSAHGNAAANQGGWSPTSGYEGYIPVTRGGAAASNVECFDCHNSHGSAVSGITSSYRGTDGTYNGGILKDTTAGKGGYRMSYRPSANPDAKSSNPYNAGAGLCFDCHETAVGKNTPWGYNSTFGAEQPIMGYKDTRHFGPGNKGSTARFASRQNRTEIASSHLKAGRFLNYSAHSSVNGLCTPCHDPHGVSPTLKEKMPYAVPLLKETWLTSPYREDSPPSALPGNSANSKRPGGAALMPGGSGSAREPMFMPDMRYNVDRNTFGDSGRVIENDDKFAGLCLKCHTREKSGGTTRAARVHRAVKGWGSNKEHSFPCSKCHQAHNSGLPRLMQTNCFEEGPDGLRENSGLSWLPDKREGAELNDQKPPVQGGAKNKSSGKAGVVGCHVRQFGRGSFPATKQGGKQWNQKTTW